MKDSDVIVLGEPKLSLGDQFYLPQVLIGLGTTMKHMLRTPGDPRLNAPPRARLPAAVGPSSPDP